LSPWVEIPRGREPEQPKYIPPTPRDNPIEDLIELISSHVRGIVVYIVNKLNVSRHVYDTWIYTNICIFVACGAQAKEAEIGTINRRMGGWNIYGLTIPIYIRDERDLMDVNSSIEVKGIQTLSRPDVLKRDNGYGRAMAVFGVGKESILQSFAGQVKRIYKPERFVTVFNPFVPINNGRGAMATILYEMRDDEMFDLGLSKEQWGKVRENVKKALERILDYSVEGGE